MEGVIMKKPESEATRTPGGVTPFDDVWLGTYPTIGEYLSTDSWDDGSVREPSSLSISLRDGQTLLALNDKSMRRSIYTQADTLEDALGLLEAALAGGKCTWRPWGGKKGR
jgi:hypothetical protein